MSEEHEHIRETVQRFYNDIWNRYDKTFIPILLRDTFTFRGSLGETKAGYQGFASYVDSVHNALDQYRCEIIQLVVEPPRAFARMRFSGIHKGVFLGYMPTHKPVEWGGAALFTFEQKHISDLWVLGDLHGLLQLLEQNKLG